MSTLDARASLLKKAIMLMIKSEVPRTVDPVSGVLQLELNCFSYSFCGDWLPSLLFVITLWGFTAIKSLLIHYS